MAPGGLKYWVWVAFCAFLVALGGAFWTRQIYKGLGVTGYGQPNAVGGLHHQLRFLGRYRALGHADLGDSLSVPHRWRTAVYRCAETMTVFAVLTAGLFPTDPSWAACGFSTGCLPYPNERYLQPDFRSPLVWDVFAISTYLTISTLFLFDGPDSRYRECARSRRPGGARSSTRFSRFGWQGTDRQWRHFSMVYLLLAGFATPLVLSVHSVVSWDFAMTQLPGWHSTIFAPYFVAGAIFSGCAMVLTLLIPMRKLLHIEDLVTIWHFDNLAKVILLTSLVVSYSYATEAFMVWYAQDPIEMLTFHQRYFGLQGYLFWMMVLCNCVIPLAAVLAAHPHQHGLALHHLDFRQHRNVARALRDYRRLADDEHRALAVGLLRAEAHRDHDHGRELRLVPDEFLVCLPSSCRSFR